MLAKLNVVALHSKALSFFHFAFVSCVVEKYFDDVLCFVETLLFMMLAKLIVVALHSKSLSFSHSNACVVEKYFFDDVFCFVVVTSSK